MKANQQYATWKRISSGGWGVYVPAAVSSNPQLGDTVEVFTATTNEIKSVIITAILKRSDGGTVGACQKK